MSEKHLEAGDALPAYSGKLRLFAMRFCPYAERTVLALNAKKLEYDLVYVNLDKKPEWFLKLSAKGAVPILEYEEGKAIFDSNIINVYLDEKYPENPLQATCPLRRAQDKIVVENFSGAVGAFFTAAYDAENLQSSMVEDYHKALENLQKELATRGSKFLLGNDPGLVDFAIFPFLERFLALPQLGQAQAQLAIDPAKYALLMEYIENMKNIPAVKSYYLVPETHAKYIESRNKGEPQYNMLDSGAVGCMRPRKKKQ